MSDCEQGAKKDTNAADDNVCNAQEGILAPHHRFGRDEDGFGASVYRGVEISFVLATSVDLTVTPTINNVQLIHPTFHLLLVIT